MISSPIVRQFKAIFATQKLSGVVIKSSISKFNPKSLTTSLLITLLAGCASNTPKVVTADFFSDDATPILSQVIKMQSLLATCRSIGQASGAAAQEVYDQWQQENWDTVVAADRVYRDLHKTDAVTFEGKLLSLQALDFYTELSRKANASYRYITLARNDRSGQCSRKMTLISKPIEMDEDVKASLVQYGLAHEAPPSLTDRVPTIAGTLTPLHNAGRSFYQLEQQLQSEDCKRPQVLTLENDWPNELYAAFCGKEGQLMACKWGTCTRQQ